MKDEAVKMYKMIASKNNKKGGNNGNGFKGSISL